MLLKQGVGLASQPTTVLSKPHNHHHPVMYSFRLNVRYNSMVALLLGSGSNFFEVIDLIRKDELLIYRMK